MRQTINSICLNICLKLATHCGTSSPSCNGRQQEPLLSCSLHSCSDGSACHLCCLFSIQLISSLTVPPGPLIKLIKDLCANSLHCPGSSARVKPMGHSTVPVWRLKSIEGSANRSSGRSPLL